MTQQCPTLDTFSSWYQRNKEQVLEDFFAFLRYPSISTDPKYSKDVRNTAMWLKDYLQTCGLAAELWETAKHPVVFASLMQAGPEAPTALFYAHYDVQPVDPLDEWDSGPFEPVIKGNQVYARGAMDCKGQCFYVVTAIKAYLELMQGTQINIKVFIEGEEEVGSVGSEGILPQREKELQADYLFLVDFGLMDAETPGIMTGMRGLLAMEIDVQNSSIDLHSGVHGGMALNPNHALVHALSKLRSESGEIAVDGFYDDVTMPSDEDLEKLNLTFDAEKYKETFGIKAFANEPNFSLIESNWLRPSLDINGMGGGYVGEGFKTVIPAKASTKISCRLVPFQDPEKIAKSIEKLLRDNLQKELDVRINVHQATAAYHAPFDTNVVKITKEAYEEVFRKKCHMFLCGATVPIVPKLAEHVGGEAVMMGMCLNSDDIHAPNEHFGLDRFEKGFLVIGRILSLCSSHS